MSNAPQPHQQNQLTEFLIDDEDRYSDVEEAAPTRRRSHSQQRIEKATGTSGIRGRFADFVTRHRITSLVCAVFGVCALVAMAVALGTDTSSSSPSLSGRSANADAFEVAMAIANEISQRPGELYLLRSSLGHKNALESDGILSPASSVEDLRSTVGDFVDDILHGDRHTLLSSAASAISAPIAGVASAQLSSYNQSLSAYSPSLAMCMAGLSNASYDVDSSSIWNPDGSCDFSDWGQSYVESQGWELQGTFCERVAEASGFVATMSSGNILVAFRGTVLGMDYVDDISAGISMNEPGGFPGKIASGFYGYYWAVRDQVQSLLEKASEAVGGEADVYVTGHSLGGAVAVLAAYDIQNTMAEQVSLTATSVSLVTFGGPRTGSPVFTAAAQSVFSTAMLVQDSGDPIPHLPPRGTLVHMDRIVKIGKSAGQVAFPHPIDDDYDYVLDVDPIDFHSIASGYMPVLATLEGSGCGSQALDAETPPYTFSCDVENLCEAYFG